MLNIFGLTKLHNSWRKLESMDQLAEVDELSKTKPVALFKHSTSCSRSAFAKEKLMDSYKLDDKKVSFFYLDLLAHRNISSAIANKYGVMHQSPQLIVIKNGKAVFDTSHESISYNGLLKQL